MYTSVDVLSADAHVEAVLVGMTLDELSHLQDALLEELRTGMPSTEQIAKALERQSVEVAAWFRFRQSTGEAVKIVMLLGAPLAMKTGRSGTLMGIGTSFALVLLYYGIASTCLALGKGEYLPPVFAAWFGNLFFAVIGIYLIKNTS